MIRHIVLIRFRADLSDARAAELLAPLGPLSARLGCRATWGKSESPEQIERGYRHGFVADFADWSALAAYQAVLRHLATELRSGPAQSQPQAMPALAAAHLPRILAASLISTVAVYEQHAGASVRRFGAGGMRDIVAPAASVPEAQIEAISAQAPSIALLIENILPRFAEIERLITLEEEPALLALLTQLQREASRLSQP